MREWRVGGVKGEPPRWKAYLRGSLKRVKQRRYVRV